ncbi:MAG TPA: hypothetical protein ENH85_06225 [Candidatus Scalindua sp.]|nr:hypothetical protein [Candidatus Scalindua sp.]
MSEQTSEFEKWMIKREQSNKQVHSKEVWEAALMSLRYKIFEDDLHSAGGDVVYWINNELEKLANEKN